MEETDLDDDENSLDEENNASDDSDVMSDVDGTQNYSKHFPFIHTDKL